MKYLFLFLLLSGMYISSIGQSSSRTNELILRLSKEKNNYMNAESVDKLSTLLDDRMFFIHSNGMSESKTDMLDNLKKGKWSIKKVTWKGEPSVRVIKNDVAVLVGKGIFYVKNEDKNMEVELYFTEVWAHYKKGWKLFSRHASKV